MLGHYKYYYIILTNYWCVINHKNIIQSFIYYVVKVTLTTTIGTSVCKSFVVKLIVSLPFKSKER